MFFESIIRLEDFKRSQYFRQVFDNAQVNRLTEETDAGIRESIILKAASSGQVTLSTKSFGRVCFCIIPM